MHATATAHPNIALVKYWGKRDSRLNLPMTGSISLTLAPMRTLTKVQFDVALEHDQVLLQGELADEGTCRGVSRVLDLLRARAGLHARARVDTHNDFPTAAGLASSASGFAALAFAASEALNLRLSRQEISILARQGSGSACRSIHGGFVEWREGEASDGQDSFAIPLAPAHYWPLSILVAVIEAGPKPISSRAAMRATLESSSFYPAWPARVQEDLLAVRQGIFERDLGRVGTVAEGNCLAMFGTMLAARPPILYWQPGTVAVMQAIPSWRKRGLEAYFTADAGPNVKVLCAPEHSEQVYEQLCALQGVQTVLRGHLGGPAERIE